jgi:hypothetical protein
MKYNVESLVDPNDINILIHSGDCTNVGKKDEVKNFIHWIQNLKGFDDKIFIAGNHDMTFEKKPDWFYEFINEENLSQSDCTYLEDNGIVIEDPNLSRPIKFYGSPWQPQFFNWGFNLPRNGSELESKWRQIPNDTDILITHGPPHGINDLNPINYSCGCELLKLRVDELKPLVHVFGHIHYSNGTRYIDNSLYVNASICNEQYEPINKPFVISLNEIDGKIITNIHYDE